MRSLCQQLRNLAIAVLFCPFALGAIADAQANGHLTLQDLLSVEPIGDSALAPDGKTIALTRAGQIFLRLRREVGPCPLRARRVAKPVLPGLLIASSLPTPVRGASGLSLLRAGRRVVSPTYRPVMVIHARLQIEPHDGLPRADGYSFRVDAAASTASLSSAPTAA